ncbi:MAG: cobalamin-binding protein [Gemmatimonadaceae bacterium]
MRIVSLLPAATEIICSLGLEDRLVGVTHECDYPPNVRRLPRVTRTAVPTAASSAAIDAAVRERVRTQQALYVLDVPLLVELRPDLIVTQGLCGVCAVAEDEVRAAACSIPGGATVLNLEPRTLAEVLACIADAGAVTGAEAQARQVVGALSARVEYLVRRASGLRQRPRVALLEWLDPPFSCGHWTPELVRIAGGVEGLGREGQASRTLQWDEVLAWQPQVVVIACCGLDVERTVRESAVLDAVAGWSDLPAVREQRVYVTDGSQYFNRPGPRLVDSLEILAHILHGGQRVPNAVQLLRPESPVYR